MFNLEEMRNALLANTPICDDAINIIMNMVKPKQYKVGDMFYNKECFGSSDLMVITKVNKKSVRACHFSSCAGFYINNGWKEPIYEKEGGKIKNIILKSPSAFEGGGERTAQISTDIDELKYFIFEKYEDCEWGGGISKRVFVYSGRLINDYNILIEEDEEGNHTFKPKYYKKWNDDLKDIKIIQDLR